MQTVMRQLRGFLGIAVAVMYLSACSNVEVKSPQELRAEAMLGTWIIESLTIDGLDAAANYPAFKIDFQQNGLYSSVNGGQVFRPTGTWTWPNNETTTQLQLDVFTDVTITAFEGQRMAWTFSYAIGGVRAGTNGNYVVTFLKL